MEVYRLPDSPLPPDSPRISDEGDHLPGSSSRLVSAEEDDNAPDHEHEMAETTTAISAFQYPPDSLSDKSSFAPEDSYDSHQPSDAQLRLSTFEPPTESVLPDSLSQVDISQESAFQSQRDPNPIMEAHKPPTLPPVPGATDIPTTDAVAAAIAHHDWNMVRNFWDPLNLTQTNFWFFERCWQFKGLVGKLNVLCEGSVTNVDVFKAVATI